MAGLCEHGRVVTRVGRDTATVLFTDLVDSTAMRAALGDDLADEVRRDHDILLRDAMVDHGGVVVKTLGDGLLATFDSASDAVGAAVAAQHAVGAYNRRARGDPLSVRIGLSAGDVVWEHADCFGTAVVEAKRLCDIAEGGSIVVAEVVRLLVGSRGGHGFEPLGPLDLKGLAVAVSAYRVPVPAGIGGSGHGIALPGPLGPGAQGSVGFVGRGPERAGLGDAWKQVVAEGRRGVTLIAGEPGVGKTRLAAEVAQAAFDDGAIVAFGRCDEDLAVPYQPWVEAITALATGASDADLAVWCATFGGDLARLVPLIVDRVPGLPPPLGAEPDTERLRLFEAVVAFFAAVSETAPVLVVLDDLHWADKGSLLVLRHLVRATTPRRTLTIGTYRDTDVDRAHPLADVLADLRRETGVTRLSLAGLSQAEVEGFVEAASGEALTDDGVSLARDIHAETEGNPFFVGQVLRHLIETGAVVQDGGRWVRPGTTTGHHDAGIPEGIREVIGRRLNHLPAQANAVLSVAAVIGREFDTDLTAAVAAIDENVVLDALEQAEEARLIAPVAGRPRRRAFVHALIRSTLYEELGTTRRLRLHRRIAEVLEARAGGAPDDATLIDLARHFGEAAGLGEVDRAVDYARRAASRAGGRLAHDEAVVLLTRGLSVVDPDDPASARTRCELFVDIADAADRAGNPDLARSSSAEAFALATILDVDALVVASALSGQGRTAAVFVAGVIDEPLIARLEAALERLASSDTVERVRVESRLAGALYFDQAQVERRRDLAEAAVARARRLGEPETLAEALIAEVAAGWGLPGFDDRAGREIADLGHHVGDIELEFSGVQWAAAGAAFCGDLAAARELLSDAEPLVDELGQVRYRQLLLTRRAGLLLVAGRLDDAEEVDEAALANGAADPGMAMQFHGVTQVALRRLRGGIEEMLPLTLAMVEQYPTIPAWRTGTMFILAELGRSVELRQHYDVLAVARFDFPSDANLIIGLALSAVACFELDDRTGAELLAAKLLPFADCTVFGGNMTDILGSTHHFLALLAATRRDWDTWENHVAEALERNEAMGAVLWSATAKYQGARAIQRREPAATHRTRASVWLDEAEAAFAAHGAPRMVNQVRTARAAWA